MPRMRSIRDTARLFKEMDPDTEITECTLRKMIAQGSIPAFKTGTKYLINVDQLVEMFGAPSNGLCKISGSGDMLAIEK